MKGVCACNGNDPHIQTLELTEKYIDNHIVAEAIVIKKDYDWGCCVSSNM